MEASHRYTPPADVKRLVLSGADDAVVADAFDHLLTSWNLEAAATNYLAVAGFVCNHRPHLTAWLLRLPIDCLVQLGAASPEQIASAVSYQDRLREEERATRAQADRQAKGGPVVLRLSAKQQGYVKSMHSQVLGEILIRLGAITREQLDTTLRRLRMR